MTRRGLEAISLKDLDRGLRGTLWPALKAHGFTDRTERVAWREVDGGIDLVEVQVVGQDADTMPPSPGAGRRARSARRSRRRRSPCRCPEWGGPIRVRWDGGAE